MLPKTKKVKMRKNYFPTKWQTVIFRNYGLVSIEKIAATIECDVSTVSREAARLGLSRVSEKETSAWEKRGYITIVRNNWYLLPYEQLLTLLAIDERRLEFILTNDDFLSVKLGDFKPICPKVVYRPLTADEERATDEIAEIMHPVLSEKRRAAFDFFDERAKISGEYRDANRRIVHGYLSPCGDVFTEDDAEYLPDRLLELYRDSGVNGLWFHGLLSTLSPYPFDAEQGDAYFSRRENLQRLIDRCAKYGIAVYLYLNEPRGIAADKLGKYAHLSGRTENGLSTLCFAKAETREYLYTAVKDLLQNVRGLGGFITITMSENPTHCNYRPHTNCPICKNIPPEVSAADVNNVIAKAVRDSGSGAEVIANLWGWSPFMEWTEEQTLRGVELLDEDISVMCVSEYDCDIEKGGAPSKVIDYSIGNTGPSEITRKALCAAAKKGHKIYAKIQTNNSWECSAVPYLPVFDLIYEHIEKLSKIGVNDYMLTWTLGGYPSPLLGMIADVRQNGVSLEEWYSRAFGKDAERVRSAVSCFCRGFKEYPFSVDSLYYSPKTLGEANLYDLEADELSSTMVCYAFDDYETWTKPYPIAVYLSQYEKLLSEWKDGMRLLDDVAETNETLLELQTYAEAAYAHFYADYLQTRFALLKRDVRKNKAMIAETLRESEKNARSLIGLMHGDAKIGFEASNHYFYSDRNLAEKILNVRSLLKELENV